MADEENGVLGLARIRRNRGLTLEHIADVTKISLRSLRAIECGEFQKLPGGIYNTSYIRQYARAIDFDPATLLAYYHNQTGIPPANPGAAAKPPKDHDLFGGFRSASTIAGS
jgi:cytoskeletal protein RodZ